MDFEKIIPEIEGAIGYTFRDKSLLRQAFTRTSYCNERRRENGEELQSNEVLEFFGDSVLSCAIISLLLKDHTRRYPNGIKTKLNEGDFSIIKSRLSDKKNLSASMADLGLQKYLLLGEGDEKQGTANEPSVMEDLFESIIGAIYIDSGEKLGTVIKSLSKMLDTDEYLKSSEPPVQNPKNALQEWCQDKAHRKAMPEYRTLDEQISGGQKVFVRACYIADELYGRGIGKNQKAADSLAAEAALLKLEAEFRREKKPEGDSASLMQRLRDIAKANKKPSPEFRDLGETKNSREGAREYVIECRFMEKTAEASGYSKRAAREEAMLKMLELLTPKRESEKSKSKQKFTKKTHAKVKSNQPANTKPKLEKVARAQGKAKNTGKRQG